MKRRFALLAVLLAIVVLAAACGTPNVTTTAPTSGITAATTEATTTLGPPAELVQAYIIFGPEPADKQLVNDELNKMTEAKINTKVTLLPVVVSQYSQQINLMMSSGEQLDLFVIFYDTRAAMISKGQIIELDELLAQYGQGIVAAIGEDALAAGKLNGKLYTLPTSYVNAGEYGYVYNKDIVNQYGIDTSGVSKIEDLAKIFAQVKEKVPNMAAIEPQMAGFSIISGYSTFDYLNDYYGVLPNYGQDSLTLVNYYETAEYASLVNLMRDWNTAGYIMKGSATLTEDTNAMISSGKVMGRFGPVRSGDSNNNEAMSKQVGFNVGTLSIMPKVRGGLVVNQYGISQSCETPDAAMRYLNLLYADPTVANLLANGIEGKHFVKGADGTIDYADGLDGMTTGWPNSYGWELVYLPITDTWKGSDPPEILMDYSKDGIMSKAYGFTFDSTPVKNEITALANVVNQYKLPLECGEVDPAEMLPQFIAKLKDAGIEKVIAEKQRQLDTWAAANDGN